MVQAHRSKRPPSGLGVRPFRIMVANCRRCGWEWPGHIEQCARCAAVVGEARAVHCGRLVAPATAPSIAPELAVVAAIEMSRRGGSAVDNWASRVWAILAPQLAGAIRVAPGHTGTILAAWAFQGPETVEDVAEIALAVSERARGSDAVGLELRGAIACGVIDDHAGTAAVESWAERLALAAGAGQWLVSLDVASALNRRFVLRAGALVCRWPRHPTEAHRSLVSRLQAPVLPSAVTGDPSGTLVGRERERRQLLTELTAVAQKRGRRVLLVSAPAGGGKSYLLRRVLADSGVVLAAGVAFPPLGSRSLDPVRALLAALDERPGLVSGDRLGATIAEAAGRRAAAGPCAVVIDDIHWASPRAVAELTKAIAQTAHRTSVAWVLLTRTSALGRAHALIDLADLTLELSPLVPSDRERLLVGRLGSVPAGVRRHVGGGPARGNPLYVTHLAELINERPGPFGLPNTLHEAVLMRLGRLAERVRQLTAWPNRSFNVQDDLQQLEREVGDWLDRLETSDIADLMTIGRYLAKLRTIDADLVIARSILGMPVATNRPLAQAVERLAAASTSALLDFLETVVTDGRAPWAVRAAEAAAVGAERALRLADAERLLTFASDHDPEPRFARRRGDIALALGRPDQAIAAYQTATSRGTPAAQLGQATARAHALGGNVEGAIALLQTVAHGSHSDPPSRDRAAWDLARLLGQPASPAPPPPTHDAARSARANAWVKLGDANPAAQAARSLVLSAEPAACAAQLIDTATLARLAGISVNGLDRAAAQAAHALDNPRAQSLIDGAKPFKARTAFLHWDA